MLYWVEGLSRLDFQSADGFLYQNPRILFVEIYGG